MNIGILIPGFSDGEQDWCIPVYLNLVRKLAEQDSVRVFALRYPSRRDSYNVYGAQVFSMGGHSSMAGVQRWQLLARTVITIIRQHRKNPFDVLHAIWADETGFAACVAGRLIGVPVVVSVAGGELVGLSGYGLQSGRISRWLVGQSLRRADCVTVPCQYAADLVKQSHVSPRKISIVPLGVDTTLFHPGDAPRDSNRLIAVGSLTNVKRHDHILNVLTSVPGVYLDIVGDGPLLATLQTQAKALGVADRVTFHSAVAHDALPQLYQQASVHLLTSIHEAFGMVTIEAAACGVPTVGYALGVLPELPGVAVPVGEVDAIITALQTLLGEPDRMATLNTSVRCEVEEHYTLDSMTNGFRKTYGHVMKH